MAFLRTTLKVSAVASTREAFLIVFFLQLRSEFVTRNYTHDLNRIVLAVPTAGSAEFETVSCYLSDTISRRPCIDASAVVRRAID